MGMAVIADSGQKTVTTTLARLLRTYTFAFALLLAVVLLIVNLIVTERFGWTEQLATFAPLAIAAMAQTPSILSGRGGFDFTISPPITFSSLLFVLWLGPAGLGGGGGFPLLLPLRGPGGVLNASVFMGFGGPAPGVDAPPPFFVGRMPP